MAICEDEASTTRNPVFKVDLEVKIIKRLSPDRARAGYAPDGMNSHG
jgi:hypothetical protein